MDRAPGNPPGTTRGFLEAMSAGPDQAGLRWSRVLVWFLRAMAVVWIVKGLGSWAVLLGIGPAGVMPFEMRPAAFQSTIIYFAVIDLVAAIGLWLTSTWGGVMWLLAVMSNLILAIFFPRVVPSGGLLIVALATLVGAYLAISWLAAREEE